MDHDCDPLIKTVKVLWAACLTFAALCSSTGRMQVIRPQLLLKGFEHVAANNMAVTDDVSIIEALGLPVKITPGSYTNIKVIRHSCLHHLRSPTYARDLLY